MKKSSNKSKKVILGIIGLVTVFCVSFSVSAYFYMNSKNLVFSSEKENIAKMQAKLKENEDTISDLQEQVDRYRTMGVANDKDTYTKPSETKKPNSTPKSTPNTTKAPSKTTTPTKTTIPSSTATQKPSEKPVETEKPTATPTVPTSKPQESNAEEKDSVVLEGSAYE